MEKQEKVLWRYCVATLAFVEILTWLLFIDNPFYWNFIRAGFILLNGSVVTYLVNLKVKVEKYNAEQALI
jgi:hypothetical protein